MTPGQMGTDLGTAWVLSWGTAGRVQQLRIHVFRTEKDSIVGVKDHTMGVEGG